MGKTFRSILTMLYDVLHQVTCSRLITKSKGVFNSDGVTGWGFFFCITSVDLDGARVAFNVKVAKPDGVSVVTPSVEPYDNGYGKRLSEILNLLIEAR